ncbi:hypothetical protein C8R46DRAFT_1221839 [Mycena filopes]|nr:hypothetical protein C8R46DRAFT_1221839 [Mycena filopes]
MRSAENREGGALNKNAGTRRGIYRSGGFSVRTVQANKKKLRDTFKSGALKILEAELERQLAIIDATLAPSAAKPAPNPKLDALGSLPPARTIATMFANQKRARTPSPDEGLQEIFTVPADSSSDESGDDEQEELVPEQVVEQAREEHGDAVVDATILADDVADWVHTVLDDAAPRDPKELGALAAASLKTAHKQKDYRSEVLFASLVDFYRWMPRMGRLSAALRVAKYHGRGPAFQRVLAAQARFFEANASTLPL